VDPRREDAYDPKTFDPAAFLARAIARFQANPRWAGQRPTLLIAHPVQAGNGLRPIAQALGLHLVADATLTPGTYRLGMKGE
jgi:hypothetical protein